MKKLKLSIFAFVAMLFASCAAFQTNVQSFAPLIKAASSVASSQTLARIKDAEKRKIAAAYLWSIANGAHVLTGTVPTEEEVRASLATFSDKGNAELESLVLILASLYADYYKVYAVDGNVQAAALILQNIAAGVESAANSYK